MSYMEELRLQGLELLLEEYNSLPPHREWVDSYAEFSYKGGEIRLSERNFSEWHLGFNINEGEDGQILFTLNRESTGKFLAALGLKEDDFKNIKKTVEENFNFAKRDKYYEKVLTRIEDVRENADLKLLAGNKLPDYKTLDRPLDKFVVFCLKNGIEYELKYQAQI